MIIYKYTKFKINNNIFIQIEGLKTLIAVTKQKVENLEQLYDSSIDTINDAQSKRNL